MGRQSTAKRRRAAKPAPRRRLPLVPLALAVVVVLGVVAAVVASLGGGNGGEEVAGLEQTRPVEVTGAPLPEPPARGEDPAVGQVAPELHGASFDGGAVDVTADGQPKLLVFLAHWCPHCQREVPVLVPWLEGGGAGGVDVYAVATATDPDRPNYPPSTWLEEAGWPTPVLADDARSSAAAAFGLPGFPYYVVLDGDGKVVARASGEKTPQQLAQLIAPVAAGGR